jgi:hypothetical protein
MRDDFDRTMSDAMADIINSPERPGAALIERVHNAAEVKAKARRSALLIAAGAGLTLNAVLMLVLASCVAANTGGGWAGAAAVLIGLTLAMLPVVPLLALGEVPAYILKKRNFGLER